MCLIINLLKILRTAVSSRWAGTGRDKIAPRLFEHEKWSRAAASGLNGVSDKNPVSVKLGYSWEESQSR